MHKFACSTTSGTNNQREHFSKWLKWFHLNPDCMVRAKRMPVWFNNDFMFAIYSDRFWEHLSTSSELVTVIATNEDVFAWLAQVYAQFVQLEAMCMRCKNRIPRPQHGITVISSFRSCQYRICSFESLIPWSFFLFLSIVRWIRFHPAMAHLK